MLSEFTQYVLHDRISKNVSLLRLAFYVIWVYRLFDVYEALGEIPDLSDSSVNIGCKTSPSTVKSFHAFFLLLVLTVLNTI